MADVWIVLVVLTFFEMCVALVWGCDRIIGPDEPETLETLEAPVTEAVSR